MANGRNPGRRKDSGRDGNGFIAIPHQVVDCQAYLDLGVHARALLIEIARQFTGLNNGSLLCSRAFMGKRGWNSSDMLSKAKRELLDGGFIFETVKGQRPNKAAWYALTWRRLDKNDRYDIGVEASFVRTAYSLRLTGGAKVTPLPASRPKNAGLVPPHGTGPPPIAPSHGTGGSLSVPSHGPIGAVSGTSSVPWDGHLLDVAISSSALNQERAA